MNPLKKKSNAIIYALSLAFVFLGLYSLKKTNDYTELKGVFLQEKKDLQANLDEMIKDYTDVVVRKKRLSKRLKVELVKMKNLRDSIATLKLDNFDLIRKYRRKIATLERENRNLFIRIDSLNTANQALAQENTIAKEILVQKETINVNLEKKYNELEVKQQTLEKKVAIAGVIKTSPIRAVAMKERSSGKLVTTSRSSRTDAFKINFDLLENPVTNSGEKTVYIQIIDENKKVVSPKGKASLKNGAMIQYTDSLEVNYLNDRMSLVSFVLVNRDDVNKGKYTVSAFVDGNYTGNAVVKLR
ncbi:conserved protein of unknown function [Tenacibaculum sp. 190130A14a]|uniref:Uncharacterized protein n=1 Tax=Tenacibaculum polynesiense TaxID=3137857 RepID=A0ABM9P9U9_9FLAO